MGTLLSSLNTTTILIGAVGLAAAYWYWKKRKEAMIEEQQRQREKSRARRERKKRRAEQERIDRLNALSGGMSDLDDLREGGGSARANADLGKYDAYTLNPAGVNNLPSDRRRASPRS